EYGYWDPGDAAYRLEEADYRIGIETDIAVDRQQYAERHAEASADGEAEKQPRHADRDVVQQDARLPLADTSLQHRGGRGQDHLRENSGAADRLPDHEQHGERSNYPEGGIDSAQRAKVQTFPVHRDFVTIPQRSTV